MLLPDLTTPGGDRVKLLDFGIAKLTNQSASDIDPQTRTGTFLGTPRYMSPEQCRGAREIAGKSDVYSFGVMLYRMLAGRAPFVADTDMALVAAHLCDPPTPLLEIVPTTTPGLARLIDSLLVKKKDERPNMAAVSAALNELGAVLLRKSGAFVAPAGPSLAEAPRAQSSASLPRLAGLRPAQSAPPPLHDQLTRSSTLRQSTGQQPQLEKPRRTPLFVGIGVAGLVFVGLAGHLATRPHDSKAAAVPTAAPRRQGEAAVKEPAAPRRPVRWTITSTPAGAEVVRDSDGQVLGTTPYEVVKEPGPGVEKLHLRRAGFRDVALSVQHDQDAAIEKVLPALLRKGQPLVKDAASPGPLRKSGPPASTLKSTSSDGHARTPLVDLPLHLAACRLLGALGTGRPRGQPPRYLPARSDLSGSTRSFRNSFPTPTNRPRNRSAVTSMKPKRK